MSLVVVGKQTAVALQSPGPQGRVMFDIDVTFAMVDPDPNRTIGVALQSDVLDFCKNAIRDNDIPCGSRADRTDRER